MSEQNVYDVYGHLYHYTTWEGALGIIESQNLRATHYEFLNDYTEIVLFRDKLIGLLLPHVREVYEHLARSSTNAKREMDRQGGLHAVCQRDTRVIVDAQYRATGNEIYIASFCGEHADEYVNSNGLLSQWRAYGRNGGCAVVFSTKGLTEILAIEANRHLYGSGHLSDVVYSDDEVKLNEELAGALEVLAHDARKMLTTVPESIPDGAYLEGYGAFVSCITRYKHHGFKEENEVRAVLIPMPSVESHEDVVGATPETSLKRKPRCFQDRGGLKVPYIELFDSSDLVLPIKKIIVGPHRQQKQRATALQIMLQDTGIEVTRSEIPFAE